MILELLEITTGIASAYYLQNGKKSCCPIDWRCPKQPVIVVRRKKPTPSLKQNVETTCQFEKLKLRVGDLLSTERRRKNTICRRPVPPHATRVMTRGTTTDNKAKRAEAYPCPHGRNRTLQFCKTFRTSSIKAD